KAIQHGGEKIFGWRWSAQRFDVYWRSLTAFAGLLGRVHLHDLKKAALTQASAIADMFAVQAFGDHSSVKVTERYYVNATGRLGPLVASLPLPGCMEVIDG
ncbi:MAG: hypothetical protein JNM18_13600, partial [Planctomycetaceae bacterium]|nr:hypothetical protein [Planctomycetaceae bacterium]